MTFKQRVRNIATLKVQGAHAVALEGIRALVDLVNSSKAYSSDQLTREINKGRVVLFKARPTEPALRNAVDFILQPSESCTIQEYKRQLQLRAHKAIGHFSSSQKAIAVIGSRLVKKNMVVFTHCHSSTVVELLLQAKRSGTQFSVHNTETRPWYQGRITAKALAKHHIPVTHYVDSAARLALKQADIAIFGADAITATGHVVNKVGSELFAEVASSYQIPLYVCSDSWKFDPLSIFGYEEPIEHRKPKEVWAQAPQGVTISNYVFERIHPDHITGIVSELGVLSPENFIQEVQRQYTFIR